MQPLNVAVIGVGHLGKEHARIFAGMEGVRLVGVVDTNPDRLKAVAKKHGVPGHSDYRALLDQVQAVSLVVPTVAHHAIALDFLERGVPILVEKPMCKNLEQARELVDLARRKGTLLQIGHIERFNPAVEALQAEVVNPRFIECHRLSSFSFRSTDIGVVLDLMIHDIDIILHLVRSRVVHVDAVGVSILGKDEDIANARLVFENGCVANVTASRVSVQGMRKIRIFANDRYISLDYQAKTAAIFKKGPKLRERGFDAAKIDPTKIADLKALLFGELIERRDLKIDNNGEPLVRELRSFIDCVRTKTEPVVPGEHGLRAMEVADMIQKRIKESSRTVGGA